MHNKLIHFTFFLDMLGFGNKIAGISNEESAKQFIDFMEENKNILIGFIELDKEREAKLVTIIKYYDFEYAFVSDSIVISLVPKEFSPEISTELYYRHSASLFYLMVNRIIGLLTHLLIKHKILLRGGITTKYAYIKDEFIVGEGIIEAYKLESQKAIYPRTILSQDITQDAQLMEALKFISKKMYNNSRLIKRDDDGYFYIDYLGYQIAQHKKNTLRERASIELYGKVGHMKKQIQAELVNKHFFKIHKEAIEEMYHFLKEKKDSSSFHHIKDKYSWIKEYHNRFMTGERSEFKVLLDADLIKEDEDE